jgi:hypothetical protein
MQRKFPNSPGKKFGGAALQGLIFQILFVWFHQEIFYQIKFFFKRLVLISRGLES